MLTNLIFVRYESKIYQALDEIPSFSKGVGSYTLYMRKL